MAKLDLPATAVLAEHNAALPMRDGTLLRADLYRPARGGPFPALLIRTPYGEPAVRTAPVLPALDAGFAVVLQYCRGTGTSDGDFSPFDSEADDGVDVIETDASNCLNVPAEALMMEAPIRVHRVALNRDSGGPGAYRGGLGGVFESELLDGEATVKTFKRSDSHVWLMPHNPDYTPIPGNDATILGKVVAVLRRVK